MKLESRKIVLVLGLFVRINFPLLKKIGGGAGKAFRITAADPPSKYRTEFPGLKTASWSNSNVYQD